MFGAKQGKAVANAARANFNQGRKMARIFWWRGCCW